MNKREEVQERFIKLYLEKGGRSILNLSPRLGKCRIGVKVMEKLSRKTLVVYPSAAIKKAWLQEFEKCGYTGDVTLTTYKSLYKYVNKGYDLAIFDEIHSLSDRQLKMLDEMSESCMHTLGLTGTLNGNTERELKRYAGYSVIGVYSIAQAIEDGIIADYEIRVMEVPLDKDEKKLVKKKDGSTYYQTEASKFVTYSNIIQKLDENNEETFSMRIKRMHLLRDSISKRKITQQLVDKYKEEGSRFLVFCPTTEIADSLGIASYHSKSTEKDLLERFCNGEIDEMSCCKMLTAGVTLTPLKYGIINSVDANSENLGQKIARYLNFEWGDKAIIYIVTSTTDVERNWVKKALEFLDPNKVVWNYKFDEEAVIS